MVLAIIQVEVCHETKIIAIKLHVKIAAQEYWDQSQALFKNVG